MLQNRVSMCYRHYFVRCMNAIKYGQQRQHNYQLAVTATRTMSWPMSMPTPTTTTISTQRHYSSGIPPIAEINSSLDNVTYERVCSVTLDALCDYFDKLTENAENLCGSDVSYADGVLTVNLGLKYGTYVINRQTPNKQIWLSSPTSGPKRYDFIGNGESGKWIYKHNGESMHQLLQAEIAKIIKEQQVDFMSLPCS